MSFPYTQIRIARPTARLQDVVAFYKEGLGLSEIGHFQDHEGCNHAVHGYSADTNQLAFQQSGIATAHCSPANWRMGKVAGMGNKPTKEIYRQFVCVRLFIDNKKQVNNYSGYLFRFTFRHNSIYWSVCRK